MRITKYKTLQDENGHPKLLKEKACNYAGGIFTTAESIVEMMNDVFLLDRQTEEYLYELCFTTKMKLAGVFEVSHGTVNCTPANPREVFQKALLCGAATVILAHNHPSGEVSPSLDDRRSWERMERAGDLIGIPVADNIIVGMHGEYFSFRDTGPQSGTGCRKRRDCPPPAEY